jgi:predicted nucleic acid-binding protein
MGPLTSLVDLLPVGALLGIDTSPFIYYMEAGSRFDAVATELFDDCIDTGRNPAVTTVVTLAEVLVGAMRSNRPDLAQRYRNLLGHTKGLRLLDITEDTAERAADLRQRYNVRLPDALQVGAAIQHGASHFVTNDDRFRRVTEIEVIILSDLA